MKQKAKNQVLIARHFIEKIIGKGDLSIYDEIISPDALGHCPESWKEIHPIEVSGRENTKQIDREYAKAFHFLSIEITEILSFNDKVFAKWNCEKIHKDTFFGINTTNRHLAISGQTLFRFQSEGKIGEVWQAWDMLGLLMQIGWRTSSVINVNQDELNQIIKNASKLTQREKNCLKLQINGKTAKDAAAILFVSPRTIEYYFENIKNKLACANKKEVFLVARILERHGFL